MATTKEPNGPTKLEFEKIKRLCAQLVEANRRLEKRVINMDERLRLAQTHIAALVRTTKREH